MLTREIYTEVLPYLNIPMTEELTEAEIAELNEKGIYNSNIKEKNQESESESEEENSDENDLKEEG